VYAEKADLRDNPRQRKHDAPYAPIRERFPTLHPADDDDQAGFEVADHGAADWSRIVDDDELGDVEQAGQESALEISFPSVSVMKRKVTGHLRRKCRATLPPRPYARRRHRRRKG